MYRTSKNHLLARDQALSKHSVKAVLENKKNPSQDELCVNMPAAWEGLESWSFMGGLWAIAVWNKPC